jgi:hypothetical protein
MALRLLASARDTAWAMPQERRRRLAKRRMSSAGGFDFGQWIERMPDEAPPKWLFNNISGIRDNTERILQLLENERATAGKQE